MIPVFNFFGDDAKFHHIGIAVDSIKNISTENQIFTEEKQRVSVAFANLNGIDIELIEPLNENSPVAESLKKGIKLVHICYEVGNIEKTLKKCYKFGFHCISEITPSMTFNNRKIVWVYSRQYGLFELLEK